MKPFFLRAAAVLACASALAGCASGWLLESDVNSFSSVPALAPNPTYRFDRLPSQLAMPMQQEQLEALADPALFKAGLKRDDAAPRYTVQVGARVQRIVSPWADPWGGWGGGGIGFYFGSGPFGFSSPFPRFDNPYYEREVSVVLRELPSNKVVYETRAKSDGPWTDNTTVLPILFEAALQGFPNPPPGPRRVNVRVEAASKG